MKTLEKTQHDADGGVLWTCSAQLLLDDISHLLHALGHGRLMPRNVLDSSTHSGARQGINLIAVPILSAGPNIMNDNSYSTIDIIEIGLIEARGQRRKGI